MTSHAVRRCSMVCCFATAVAAAADVPPAAGNGSSITTPAVDPLDWPSWRGPQQNGISTEKGLVDRWDPGGGPGSNLLWKSAELGGRSTPIVLRGKLYTIVRAEPGTAREGEKVVCVDAATGIKQWEHRFNVYLSDVPDTRVGWSCCVADPKTGHIYALGVCGYFVCLDGETGDVLWSRSLHEQYGLLSTYGGRTNVPVVFEDLVIVSAVVIGWDTMAKPAHRFMAFDKMTGEIIWFEGTRLIPDDTTYSVPFLTVLDGQAALVFGSGDGQVWAMQPRTGAPIWSFDFSRRGLNVSPIVVDDIVYTGHSEENLTGTRMGALVAIDGSAAARAGKVQPLWQTTEVMVGKSSPLLVGGRLYVIDDRAKLLVFDPRTGEQLFRQPLGTVQRSSPLYADGKIYTCTNNGRWYILKPTDRGVEVLHRLRLPSREMSDGSPLVSHGRLYVPSSGHLYCIGNSAPRPAADPLPAAPQEKPIAQDDAVAVVRVVPCEVLLRPGEKQSFRVRRYNARGQRLPDAPATFTATGAGEIAADGTFVAATDQGHTSALVTARVGDRQSTARIRIVPPLPWTFNFDEVDDIPITWVGGRVRHVIRDVDGERVAVKRDLLPAGPGRTTKLGTRSRCWMGPDDLSNYTVQADVLGTIKDGKMPDIGLINQRYTLCLQGASQELRIYSWCTHDRRSQATIPFAWSPDRWYTMKVRVDMEAGVATIRGKLWPRGEAEPDAWAIKVVDEAPNRSGSPGLFGNAKDAEFYLDNITVTPNEDLQ